MQSFAAKMHVMSSCSSNQTKPKKTQSDMNVIAEYSPMDILPWTGPLAEPEEFEVEGKVYRVKMRSLRYQTFRKSLKCATCGVEGVLMRLEYCHGSDPYRPHFNLYAITEEGLPLLMTRDHIIPSSRGGTDAISNQQTMCTACNCKKGNKMPGEPI